MVRREAECRACRKRSLLEFEYLGRRNDGNAKSSQDQRCILVENSRLWLPAGGNPVNSASNPNNYGRLVTSTLDMDECHTKMNFIEKGGFQQTTKIIIKSTQILTKMICYRVIVKEPENVKASQDSVRCRRMSGMSVGIDPAKHSSQTVMNHFAWSNEHSRTKGREGILQARHRPRHGIKIKLLLRPCQGGLE